MIVIKPGGPVGGDDWGHDCDWAGRRLGFNPGSGVSRTCSEKFNLKLSSTPEEDLAAILKLVPWDQAHCLKRKGAAGSPCRYLRAVVVRQTPAVGVE